MCATVAKVGQGRTKSKYATHLRDMNFLAQVIGVLEPDNRKLGQAIMTEFHKVKVIDASQCTSLLDGFTLVVIAFEMWIISDPLYNCVSQSQK